jgi:GPH family glycoside/pentoside/hexuronide:cation symporter
MIKTPYIHWIIFLIRDCVPFSFKIFDRLSALLFGFPKIRLQPIIGMILLEILNQKKVPIQKKPGEGGTMANDKLSFKVKLGYGVCDLGGNMLFTIIAFWLMNFLTDTVGLAAGLAGVALTVGKIWDGVIDPAIGYISDHTVTRWGRRRPYIFIGGIATFLAMVLMFTNPKLSDQTLLFIWAIVIYCLLCMAGSIINIPYSSLTPELTSDYHERTVLNGYRMTFAVVGTFIGAGTALPILGLFKDKSAGFLALGVIYGLITMAVSLITFFTVKESSVEGAPGTPAIPSSNAGGLKSYRQAFRNVPYLLILIPWVCNMIATTMMSGTLIYYFKYIYHAGDSTTMAMMILLGTTMLFIPVWVWLSRRLGKKNCYALGMTLIAIMGVIFFLYGHQKDPNFAFVLMALAGIGLATTYIIPWSIVPDTVEYDYSKTGERREGIYYGIWTFACQLGQALAAFFMGTLLDLYHYIPNRLDQSASAIFGIRLLIGLIPAAIYLTGSIIVLFYPIDEKRYREMVGETGVEA